MSKFQSFSIASLENKEQLDECPADVTLRVISGYRFRPLISRIFSRGNLISVSAKMALHKDNFNLKSAREIKPCVSNLVISRTVNVNAEFACEQSSVAYLVPC